MLKSPENKDNKFENHDFVYIVVAVELCETRSVSALWNAQPKTPLTPLWRAHV